LRAHRIGGAIVRSVVRDRDDARRGGMRADTVQRFEQNVPAIIGNDADAEARCHTTF